MPKRLATHVIATAFAVVAVAATSAVAEPDAARRTELGNLLRHDCGSCHGLTLAGGLGPPLTAQALAARDERQLIDTILHGRPGTPMAPWAGILTPEETAWLVRAMKQGASAP